MAMAAASFLATARTSALWYVSSSACCAPLALLMMLLWFFQLGLVLSLLDVLAASLYNSPQHVFAQLHITTEVRSVEPAFKRSSWSLGGHGALAVNGA
jgi:hypothetical protein